MACLEKREEELAFVAMTPDQLRRQESRLLAVAEDQPDEYWALDHFLQELPGKWELSFLVVERREVLGYVVASRKEKTRVHIHHFMVRPDIRGHGLGHRMMAEISLRARGLGGRELSVKVRSSNVGAKRFYSRQGFKLKDEPVEYQQMCKPLAPAVVAIHQPNYLPWLGYFHKIAKADVFVFLDDVQFTKGGYTNRVQILSPKGPKWLSVPVKVSLGDPIDAVQPSKAGWASSHADTLRGMYAKATAFKTVWSEIRAMLEEAAEEGNLAAVNMSLVRALAARLGMSCVFRRSSDFVLESASDDRLIELVAQVAPGGTYLSGKGAAKYQDPSKFEAVGLGFQYMDFAPPQYPQDAQPALGEFVGGLSVLDAVFHLGWDGAAELVVHGEQG